MGEVPLYMGSAAWRVSRTSAGGITRPVERERERARWRERERE